MEPAPCLWLLLLSLLRVSAGTSQSPPPEPCELDDEDIRCACNFSGPQPDWSSALQCTAAVEVEIRAGGRSLEPLLKRVDPEADPRGYADLVRGLRVRRLALGAARVPAPLLLGALRVLAYSRLRELTLADLEVTGTPPPPPPPASGLGIFTLRLRNVSWAAGGAGLAQLQQWLQPSLLKVLSIAQAHSLAFACKRIRSFPALTTLDLSDNPGLGERGLVGALCPHKFPALQDLALRNAGMETPSGVCAALAKAGVPPHSLDLSHNSLRAIASAGDLQCVWPGALNSLNLSFSGLEQVPQGLPAKLNVLDLSYNRLNRAPRLDELPKVGNLSLEGNPFLLPEAPRPQENAMNSEAGMAPACARSHLAVGMSGTLAVLQGVRGFA
ncbi:PREDICTED: monocyte differentiation antigen CD14 [Chinchilla lanigera]|uniref:Monocyte differentiation antigen CD14 n=1 Tax=Chinchilla lanigera TaxID=34839 RepID=A0A8C2VQR5_CHILA|nr:PREDICTED: monocyte differentiation antigen CD14 [Chinchilla lanigera]